MKKICFAMMIFWSVLLSHKIAFAAGVGLYATGGGSMSNWKYKDKNYGSTTDYFFGGGLVVDTAIAKNTLLNYRITAGYERYGSDSTSLYMTNSKKTAHKFDMSHTLGFGVYRSKAIRFWAGPELGLHCIYSLDFQHVQYSLVAPYLIGDTGWATGFGEIFYTSPTKKMLAIGIDALLAIGINVNLGEYTALFAHAGFGYMGTYQLKGDKETGNGCGAKVKISIMFRFNDSYDASPVAM